MAPNHLVFAETQVVDIEADLPFVSASDGMAINREDNSIHERNDLANGADRSVPTRGGSKGR